MRENLIGRNVNLYGYQIALPCFATITPALLLVLAQGDFGGAASQLANGGLALIGIVVLFGVAADVERLATVDTMGPILRIIGALMAASIFLLCVFFLMQMLYVFVEIMHEGSPFVSSTGLALVSFTILIGCIYLSSWAYRHAEACECREGS